LGAKVVYSSAFYNRSQPAPKGSALGIFCELAYSAEDRAQGFLKDIVLGCKGNPFPKNPETE
jgi:hypothetical protein